MKKNELFGLKNMFPSNNIASVGVKISCPHTEGVFYCSSYTTQTQTRAVYIILFQYCQSQLDEVKVGFDLYCCAELSEKKLLSWLDKYGQTESRVFYPRMSLYVINRHDPGSVKEFKRVVGFSVLHRKKKSWQFCLSKKCFFLFLPPNNQD